MTIEKEVELKTQLAKAQQLRTELEVMIDDTSRITRIKKGGTLSPDDFASMYRLISLAKDEIEEVCDKRIAKIREEYKQL